MHTKTLDFHMHWEVKYAFYFSFDTSDKLQLLLMQN